MYENQVSVENAKLPGQPPDILGQLQQWKEFDSVGDDWAVVRVQACELVELPLSFSLISPPGSYPGAIGIAD